MRMPVIILIMGWVLSAYGMGYAAPRLAACPLPWGVGFVDPDGVQRTPGIGEGVSQPAFSPAGAGRVRGHSALTSLKVNPQKQVSNSRRGPLAGDARSLRQPGSDKPRDAAIGGLIHGQTVNNGALVRAPNVVRSATPTLSSVRHRSPNPAVVSGSLPSHGARTGTIDGTRMNHKM